MYPEKIFVPQAVRETVDLLEVQKIDFHAAGKACCFDKFYPQGIDGCAVELGYLINNLQTDRITSVFEENKQKIKFYPDAEWMTFHLHSKVEDFNEVTILWRERLNCFNKPFESFKSILIAETQSGVEIFGSVFEDSELTDGEIFDFIHQNFPAFRVK